MGIEIEICVEEIFYKSLKRNGTALRHHFEFNNKDVTFKGIDSQLQDVILTIDPSCDCSKFTKRRKRYISAEINSPALHKDELNKFYDKFLKEILFKDMEKINQGRTCGVHIHWSNSFLRDNLVSEVNPNFILEFMKIIDNFRRLNVRKIIKPEFSGREDIYTELEKGSNIIIISPIYNKRKQIFRIKDLRIDLSNGENFHIIKEKYIKSKVEFYKFKVVKPTKKIAKRIYVKNFISKNASENASEYASYDDYIDDLIKRYYLRMERAKEYLKKIDDPKKKKIRRKNNICA